MERLVYGKEHTFLEPDTELLFRGDTDSPTTVLHTHTFYELFIVTDGLALHKINDSVQTINKGDLILIRPPDTHCYGFYKSDNFRILNVGFGTRIMHNIHLFTEHAPQLKALDERPLPPCISLDDEGFQDVTGSFRKIGELMKTSEPTHTFLHAQTVIAGIFINYLFAYGEKTSEKHLPKWFAALISDMQKIENLQQGYSGMISLAPCSENHLCRLFQKHFGVTSTEYINDRRLNYAVYLLLQTEDEIVEISEYCGFNSLSYFYHLFKTKYHCSPSKFRKNHKI